jgi:hypothetical protein
MSDDPPLIAALENGLCPFAADEITEMATYRQLVADLDSWSLTNQETFSVRLGGGEALVRPITVDDIAGMAMGFRKLGWAEKDPATFNKIMNLIGRHAREAGTADSYVVRQWLGDVRQAKRGIFAESRALSYEIGGSGEPRFVVTPTHTLEMLINGVFFHSDPELRARWESLNGFNNPALLLIAVITIWDMIKVFRVVDAVVEHILGSPSLTP